MPVSISARPSAALAQKAVDRSASVTVRRWIRAVLRPTSAIRNARLAKINAMFARPISSGLRSRTRTRVVAKPSAWTETCDSAFHETPLTTCELRFLRLCPPTVVMASQGRSEFVARHEERRLPAAKEGFLVRRSR
jgi:hypothetical protein